MFQGVGAVDASIRIDFQALSYELLQTLVRCQKLVTCLHAVDILPMLHLPFSLGLTNVPISEQTTQACRRSFIDHPLRKPSTILLDHNKMFHVWMCREKQVTTQQFDYNTSDRPHVCNFIPLTALKDHFRRAVLSCANDRAVSLIEKCSPTEIDNSYLGGFWSKVWIAIGCIFKKLLFFEEYIFRLEIGMCVANAMNKSHSS